MRAPLFRRRVRSFLAAVALAAMFGAYAWMREADMTTVAPQAGQRADVRDGDTLVIGATRIRIQGMDAPEYHQMCTDMAQKSWPCGKVARDRLASIAAMPGLSCTAADKDRFGRALSTCRTDQVTDIARTMIIEGLAVRYHGRAGDAYADAEQSAQKARIGIWAGSFQRPEDWRAANPRTGSD